MFDRTLAGREREWGPDHISTLDTLHNLGFLCSDLGHLQEAKRMYYRVLASVQLLVIPELYLP